LSSKAAETEKLRGTVQTLTEVSKEAEAAKNEVRNPKLETRKLSFSKPETRN